MRALAFIRSIKLYRRYETASPSGGIPFRTPQTCPKLFQDQARALLEDLVQGTSPGRPGSLLGALRIDVVPVELPPASVDVDLVQLEPSLALPEVSADPEEDDDEEGKVAVEEVVSGTDLGAKGGDGSVELERSVRALRW